MEIFIDKKIEATLDKNHIYQAKTGMVGTREIVRHRWKLGEKITYAIGCRIEPFSTIARGNRLYTCGSFSSISSNLPVSTRVGRYVDMGDECKMLGFRHPVESVCMTSAVFSFAREHIASYFEEYEAMNGTVVKNPVPTPQPQLDPLVIGNDVWVGNNCTLGGGVTIHDGAVVASNSVVLKDVPPYTVVAGVPAQIKKLRFSPDIVFGLLKSKWWDYELGDMYREGLDFSSPKDFLKRFEMVKGNLRKYNPKPFVPAVEFSNPQFGSQHGSLITRWGTIVTLVESERKLKHLCEADNPVKVSIEHGLINRVRQTCEALILNGFNTNLMNCSEEFKVENNMYGSVSIKLGDYYLSARPKGEFSLVKQNNEWEHFYVVE